MGGLAALTALVERRTSEILDAASRIEAAQIRIPAQDSEGTALVAGKPDAALPVAVATQPNDEGAPEQSADAVVTGGESAASEVSAVAGAPIPPEQGQIAPVANPALAAPLQESAPTGPGVSTGQVTRPADGSVTEPAAPRLAPPASLSVAARSGPGQKLAAPPRSSTGFWHLRQPGNGKWLHQSGQGLTGDVKFAWAGTEAQMQRIQERFELAADLVPVPDAPPPPKRGAR